MIFEEKYSTCSESEIIFLDYCFFDIKGWDSSGDADGYGFSAGDGYGAGKLCDSGDEHGQGVGYGFSDGDGDKYGSGDG